MDVVNGAVDANQAHIRDDDGLKVQEQFAVFLQEREIYIGDVRELDQPERNTLLVKFIHVQEDNPAMAEQIITSYYRFYPFLSGAVRQVASDLDIKIGHKQIYVAFTDFDIRNKVRELTSERIGSMMRISGQVVRTHPVHPELCKGFFTCDECNTPCPNIEQQFKYTQPPKCMNPACQNRIRFQLDVHKSLFTDFQKVRIQETQAEMPRGSIPRSVEVIIRGECVETAQPGDRCDFTGTLIVIPDVAQMAIPGAKVQSGSHHRGQKSGDNEGLRGLKTLGVRDLNYKLAFLACSVVPTNPKFGGRDYSHEEIAVEELHSKMTNEEKKKVKEMSEDKSLVKNMINSLFPAIHGNDEVKKGVMLMLFGGVPKTTGEGTTLRGDINVCIVGDPSTAKSQMLKQIEEFSPRAVYTSGKASSAAGLTAAVVKDEESYEFVIEAGALMLADNGVCCIDEFDKMDPRDQVAIHEAMEQQTISLTKAGVKATLNARTSILAAANPIGGRYERSKPLRQNIQLSAPIMSRFDLFFILIDECNEVTDYAIAQRILETHQKKEDIPDRRKYNQEDVQRYITFARCFKPQISDEAAERMVVEYKQLRMRDSSGAAHVSSWRVTVRQLESMVRLSEALAKLHLDDLVRPEHVIQAASLLNKSIVRVEQSDIELEQDVIEEEVMEQEPVADESSNVGEDEEGARKHRMTFDEYKQITNLLVAQLRKEQDIRDGNEEMMRESELVNWYLEEIQEDLQTEADIILRKEIVEKVIQRLVKKDNILIELTPPTEEETPETDPMLVVHPNYGPEGY